MEKLVVSRVDNKNENKKVKSLCDIKEASCNLLIIVFGRRSMFLGQ